MLATSLKDAEQIRSGNLLSLPSSLNFEAWALAWSGACTDTGTDCRGLNPSSETRWSWWFLLCWCQPCGVP
jgi:glucose/mannose transport system permease protein